MTLFQVGKLQESQKSNEGRSMAKSSGYVRAMTMDHELHRPTRNGNSAGYDRRKELRDIEPVDIQRTKSLGSDKVKLNERVVRVSRLNQSNSSLNSSDSSLNNSHNNNIDLNSSQAGYEKKSKHLPQRDYTIAQKKTNRPKLHSNGKSTSSESESGALSFEPYDGDIVKKSQFSNGTDLDPVANELRQSMQRELETKLRRHSNQSRSSSAQSWSDHDPLDSSASDVFAASYESHLTNGHRPNARMQHPNSGSARFLNDLQDEKSPGYRKVYLPDRAFGDSIGGCLKLYEQETANGHEDTNGDTGSNGSRSSGKTRRERNLLRDLVCLLYRKDLLLDEARPYVRRALQLCEIDARTLNK